MSRFIWEDVVVTLHLPEARVQDGHTLEHLLFSSTLDGGLRRGKGGP